MKVPHRRQFLHLAASAAALPAMSRNARAQAYPVRPVRILLGYPAGDSPDLVARIMGRWLSERLGQAVIVENKPGAGTNIAAQTVATAPPDGYTLLGITTANASNVTFYEALPFNFLREIVPVAGLVRLPLVMEVNPSVPAKTVSEFIAYAKANPGKLNMASAGVGGVIHLSGELFKTMAGVDLLHAPYRGSPPAITDLIGGRVQVMFDALPASLPHIRSGALRPLAVTTAMRSGMLPDVPTVGDSVPDYEASVWMGVGGRTGTPPEVIALLNREINAGLADADIKAQLGELGSTPMLLSPSEFHSLLAAETEKWGKVLRAANIKAD
jgi:tripartite-type tricarboxylate transporter receptor subunit TctC